MKSNAFEMSTNNAITESVSYIYHAFYCIIQKWCKFSPKAAFFVIFSEVFGLHPVTPCELRPNFLPNESSY